MAATELTQQVKSQANLKSQGDLKALSERRRSEVPKADRRKSEAQRRKSQLPGTERRKSAVVKAEGEIKTKQVAYSPEAQNDYVILYLDTLKTEFERRYHSYGIPENLSRDDFDIIKTLGSGAFATVFLVRDKVSLKYLAMKSVEKAGVMKNNMIANIYLEKKFLRSIEFPFAINSIYAFKDNIYVFFLMPFAPGGEIAKFIKMQGSFSEELAQFYAAQLVLGLEYLHYCNIVHRDIKAENVFVFEDGYIKIADFGFSKIIRGRTWTICGTPEYIAPEILISKGYSFGVDWWALGILIYEMVVGHVPFLESNTNRLYNRILTCNYKVPMHLSLEFKTLIKKFLVLNPANRIGCSGAGAYDIKACPWFNSTNWIGIFRKEVTPPFIPNIPDTQYSPHDSGGVMLKIGNACQFEDEFHDF